MIQVNDDLIIPVYLNQRIVFDLIAMLKGGISTITRISSMESTDQQDDRRYGGAFGLSQALSSLLKIDVSGKKHQKKSDSAEIQRDEERVHTPSSLLQNLRTTLKKEDKIIFVDKNYKPEPRHIVEFTAFLRRNPLVQTMDAFLGLMDMAIGFASKTKHPGAKKIKSDEPKIIRKQMEKFLETLKAGDTVDIVSDTLECDYRAVITLEQEYLNDPTMSDLVDGQFIVMGKIIRVVPDVNSSISLIRKSALSAMPKSLLIEGLSHISKLSEEKDFSIPELELDIKGPVIHVLPVAIFA